MKIKPLFRKITVLTTAASMLLSAAVFTYADTDVSVPEEETAAASVEETADPESSEGTVVTEPEEELSAAEPSEKKAVPEQDDRQDSADTQNENGAAAEKAGEQETPEDIIEEDIAEAPAVAYSVMTGNVEGYTYIMKFADADRVYTNAVLMTGSGDDHTYSEGDVVGNFVFFTLPSADTPVTVSVDVDGVNYVIDLLELEKKELEETVEGYLAKDEETAALLAGENDSEEIVDESLVLESEDLSPEALEEALGQPVLSKKYVVMIDPGHGGSDPGACWTWEGINIHEADINLAISKLLQKELAKYDITAYLTREDDSYILWEERVRKAAEAGAALLASVHIDTAGGTAPYANGVSIFQAKIFDGSFNQENAEKGQALAKMIIDELVNIGFGKQPPVFIEAITDEVTYDGYGYADSYKIIRFGQIYNVPSVIIEHGFLDSEHDYYTYLCNDTVRQKVAEADAKAIAGYLGVTAAVSQKPGWHTNPVGRYYITEKGRMCHGWKTIGKYRYYFDEDGYAVTGTPIIGGAKYWFDAKGRMRTGWLTWNGMKLYFRKKNGKACLNGLYKISGKYYLFNGDGVRYENGTPIFEGKKYFAKNGVLRTGWQTLGDWKLYFDKTTLAAVTGFTEISDKTYYFNSDGVLMTSRFIVQDGKRYYANAKGVIVSGWKTVDGKRYYFDPDKGNAAATGRWYEVNGKKCVFTSKGVQKTGFTKIGNYTYYLYKEGGFAVGTPIISGKKYCFTAKGHQKTGWVNLSGMKLYFDPKNNGAAVLSGTITLDGITYLFNSDGVLIGQSDAYVTATDVNGIEYTLEGTYLTDPQIGKDVTENEFLASVVYAECGSEDYCAQVACAMVILNRMNTAGFPDSLPFVIYKKDQFAVARIEGDQSEPALTRYLKAYRDDDASVLQYIENAQTMKAVKAAKKIMKAYKETGADRYIQGFPYNNGETDFKCLYFMTPAAFERLGLDYDKTNAVTCTSQRTGASTVFFDVWIKK